MEEQGLGTNPSIFPESAIPLSPKAQAFRRLAEARLGKLDSPLRILGNLANPASYDFHAADVEVIFGALEAKIAEQKALFVKSLNRKRKG